MTTALADDMAKKKADDAPPTGDYFLLRLPTEYWHLLHKLRKKNSRHMGTEAQIAIEHRCKSQGVPFKPNHPQAD